MAKCPSCGANVNASDKRCSKCGAKLDNEKSKTNSSKLIIGIILVVVIIAVIGAFASGIFTNNGVTNQTNDDSSVETVEPITENSNNNDSNSGKSASTEFWASEKTDKFHLPDCEWAEKISDTNKIIYDTREDAIADGKKPCSVCNP